jgi:hypothetical protein
MSNEELYQLIDTAVAELIEEEVASEEERWTAKDIAIMAIEDLVRDSMLHSESTNLLSRKTNRGQRSLFVKNFVSGIALKASMNFKIIQLR